MRFVIAPDSYKGSLGSAQAGQSMARAILDEIPYAEVTIIPMADGGEGTVEALVAATAGRTVTVRAAGPLGSPVETSFGVLGGRPRQTEETAVFEAANIAGLTMVPADRRNPLDTTSKGLGELIVHALDEGYRKLVIGLGGSATNDGGLGLLQALGVRYYDSQGTELGGFGRDLQDVERVDYSGLDSRLEKCDIVVASDVRNPLCGPEGASMVYGPQKGASFELASRMDQAMQRYAAKVESHLKRPIQLTPGAGAAGGLGFALLSLGAKIIPGAQVVEQITGLRRCMEQADWVITGEGRSDGQTLFGKLPMHVAEVARQAGVRTILISGSLGEGHEQLREHFAGCFSIALGPSSLQACMDNAESMLYGITRNVARLIYHATEVSKTKAEYPR